MRVVLELCDSHQPPTPSRPHVRPLEPVKWGLGCVCLCTSLMLRVTELSNSAKLYSLFPCVGTGDESGPRPSTSTSARLNAFQGVSFLSASCSPPIMSAVSGLTSPGSERTMPADEADPRPASSRRCNSAAILGAQDEMAASSSARSERRGRRTCARAQLSATRSTCASHSLHAWPSLDLVVWGLTW